MHVHTLPIFKDPSLIGEIMCTFTEDNQPRSLQGVPPLYWFCLIGLYSREQLS